MIYTQGQTYAEGSDTPASHFDHQTPFIDFWLKFVGVQQVTTLVVANTWSDEVETRIAAGKAEAAKLAATF